jgi:predicted MFS family arabinose efflux permease
MIVTASALGMALAPGYWPLFAATLLGAVGRAVAQPIAIVIASNRLDGDRQRRAISWVMAGMSGAVLIGVPALTAVADTFGWRAAFACLAMLTAGLVPLARHGLGPDVSHERTGVSPRHILAAYSPLIRHRPTVSLILATLLGNAGHWVTMTYLGAFLAERHGYTTQQIGLVYLVPGTALVVGYAVAAGRVTTLPLRPLGITTRTLVGASLVGVMVLPIPALAGIGLLGVMGIAHAIALVVIVLLLVRESPASRATTLALNTVALSLGQALGAMLGGVLLGVSDFPLLGMFALAFSATAALLIGTTRVVSIPVPLSPQVQPAP